MTIHSFDARLWRGLLNAALLLLVGGITWAANLAFEFHHVGNFSRMIHTGDTSGRAAVSSLQQAAGTWGVGATAGLKAEMIQIDGRLLVTPGSDGRGRVRPPEAHEQALLWASARVTSWAESTVPDDMDQPAFEKFVQEQARAQGLSLDHPFPFRVTGAFPRLRWHVVTGESPASDHSARQGAHGAAQSGNHANVRSGIKVFHDPGATGQLVFVYSGIALEGVVSHPGERFHAHYVDDKLSVSGHVDAYAVARGALLRLPQR